MKALVTGGAGFIGSHVAKSLLKEGYEVVLLDDLSGGNHSNVPQQAHFVKGSITDYELLQQLFAEQRFDYVFHLAAYAAEGLSHFIRRYNYQNNLIGSANLINQSILHNVKCFVFTSSIAVYGAGQVPMTEALTPQPEDPIFMLELAHYEWVELALSILNEEVGPSTHDPEGGLLQCVPTISPLAWPLSYHFPVHKISPDFQPTVASENLTHLVVYRDRNHEVNFIEANPVTARLLQLIAGDGNKTGQVLLEQIAAELNHPQPEMVINGGLEILIDLKKRDVILVDRQ